MQRALWGKYVCSLLVIKCKRLRWYSRQIQFKFLTQALSETTLPVAKYLSQAPKNEFKGLFSHVFVPLSPNSSKFTPCHWEEPSQQVPPCQTHGDKLLKKFLQLPEKQTWTSAFHFSRSRHLSHIGKKQTEVWYFYLISCFPNCKTPVVFYETGTQKPYKQLFSSLGKAKNRHTNALCFWTRFW